MEIRIALTKEEKEAVYRSRCAPSPFRDQPRRPRLVDPEDENSWLLFAAGPHGEVTGSYRITRGSDGFSLRQIERYGLEPFLAELAPRLLAVIERLVVPATEPNGNLAVPLLRGARQVPGWEGIHVVFGACVHRLADSLPFGRIYRPVIANQGPRDELVHVVAFPRGLEALSGAGAGAGLPACVAEVVRTSSDVELGPPNADLATPEPPP